MSLSALGEPLRSGARWPSSGKRRVLFSRCPHVCLSALVDRHWAPETWLLAVWSPSSSSSIPGPWCSLQAGVQPSCSGPGPQPPLPAARPSPSPPPAPVSLSRDIHFTSCSFFCIKSKVSQEHFLLPIVLPGILFSCFVDTRSFFLSAVFSRLSPLGQVRAPSAPGSGSRPCWPSRLPLSPGARPGHSRPSVPVTLCHSMVS